MSVKVAEILQDVARKSNYRRACLCLITNPSKKFRGVKSFNALYLEFK